MKFVRLPPKGSVYSPGDIAPFIAKEMRVSLEQAEGLIPEATFILPKHFHEYKIIVAKSFGEIRAFRFVIPNQHPVHANYFEAGTMVAIMEKKDQGPLPLSAIGPYADRIKKLQIASR